MMSRPDQMVRTPSCYPLLAASHPGRPCYGTALALPVLLRQLHHCFRLPCQRRGVELLLELDPALTAPLMLDAMLLQALVRHWLADALQEPQLQQICLRVQVWAQQQLQQIISVELITQGQAPQASRVPDAPDRARKAASAAALSSAFVSRQLARQLGSRAQSTYSPVGQQRSVLLHVPLATANVGIPSGQWPILLLEQDAARAAELARQWQHLGHPLEILDTVTAVQQRWQHGPLALLLVGNRKWLAAGQALVQSMRQREAAEPWRGHTPVLLPGTAYCGNAAHHQSPEDACLPWPADDATWLQAVAACLPVTQDQTASLPVLDRRVLFDLSQGDWALELPLLQGFIRDKQADLQHLLHAWQQSDQTGFILLAHRIKGASRTVGAAAMADCAERLEREARSALSAACMALLLELEQALDDFVSQLPG